MVSSYKASSRNGDTNMFSVCPIEISIIWCIDTSILSIYRPIDISKYWFCPYIDHFIYRYIGQSIPSIYDILILRYIDLSRYRSFDVSIDRFLRYTDRVDISINRYINRSFYRPAHILIYRSVDPVAMNATECKRKNIQCCQLKSFQCSQPIFNEKFWEELIFCSPFPSCWKFIRKFEYMYVMLVLLMEGIYEVSSWDGLRWHDIHTKFHKFWFMHSNVCWGAGYKYRQTAKWSHKPTYIITK
jgi:hypothetical protein